MNLRPKAKASCHPDKLMRAHGLCDSCYQKQHRVGYYLKNKAKWLDGYSQRLRRVRDAIFDKFGNRCRRCGFSDPRAFQIDHVEGKGFLEREFFRTRRLKYLQTVLADTTGRYQLLCANCNWIKRAENKEFGNTARSLDAKVTSAAEGGLPDTVPQVEQSA